MSTPLPLINGNRYSFSSIEASFGGRRFVGIKAINYSDSQEPGEVRGTAPQLIGRTRGKYSAEADFEMYRAEWQDFIDFLMAGQAPFVGLHDIVFDVSVSYAETGSPVVNDVIRGCRIKKAGSSNQEGTDPSMIKNDLHVMSIKWNGIRGVGDINTQGQGA